MLISQVEGFLETARHRNLSRAAEALHVSQPALTARIQALEAELGAPLFVRGRFGMAMTDAGRAFLPYAERALVALDAGASLLTELRRGGTGELVLGAAPAVSTYVLPALLVRFTRRFPKVRLIVRTGHSEEILDMALRREIDLGLVRELQHPDIEIHPLYDDELVLVAGGSHHFGDRAFVGLPELAEARLILFDRTSSYYELTNAFFREAGVAPSGVIELDNIDAAKQMVGQGLGIALLPHTSVAAELADGRLRAIDIQGAAPIRRRIVAIRRRDIGPALGPVGAFLEVLGDVASVLPGIADRNESPGDRRGRPPGGDRDEVAGFVVLGDGWVVVPPPEPDEPPDPLPPSFGHGWPLWPWRVPAGGWVHAAHGSRATCGVPSSCSPVGCMNRELVPLFASRIPVRRVGRKEEGPIRADSGQSAWFLCASRVSRKPVPEPRR